MDPNDDKILNEVFKIRESLTKTKNSLKRMNNSTKSSGSNKEFENGVNDSTIMPPPLTMDDLGENDGERKINESILRQWNLNASNISVASNQTRSRRFESMSARDSISETSHPQTSSPNDRFKALGARAFSCSNIPSTHNVYEADSYRMLKQPSFTSYKTVSPTKGSSSSDNVLFDRLDADVGNASIPLYSRSQDSTPSKSLAHKENVTPRPYSARSNATSITLLGAEAENDRLRTRLATIRNDNEHLSDVVQELKQSLKYEQDKAKQMTSQTTHEIEKLREINLALREEKDANETAIRKAEDKLDRCEMEFNKKCELNRKLQDEIKQMRKKHEEETQLIVREKMEAYNDAQVMAERLDAAHAEITKLLASSKRSDSNLATEIVELKHKNTRINAEMSNLKQNILELNAKLRESDNMIDSLKRTEMQLQEKCQRSNLTNRNASEEINKIKQSIDVYKKQMMSITSERDEALDKINQMTQRYNQQNEIMLLCQQQLEEEKMRSEKFEKEIKKKELILEKSAKEIQQNDNKTDTAENRELKAQLAEAELRLESKQSLIERLESRVRALTHESDRLEDIRSELVNVVERSRLGENRAKELEAVIRAVEDERSKVTRELLESRNKVSDQSSEIQSLEIRLKDRTNTMIKQENEISELKKEIEDSKNTINKLKFDLQKLKDEFMEKCAECERQITAVEQLTQEVSVNRRALNSATEWTGKREIEARRELERIKTIHGEQHKDMEAQIENLEAERNKYKKQVALLKTDIGNLQNRDIMNCDRISSLEHEIASLRSQSNEEQTFKEEKLNDLQLQARESSEQMITLQTALTQCKDEIKCHVDRFNDVTSKFQHDMTMKKDEILKLESELKMSRESLECEIKRANSAENGYRERQELLENASKRVHELEQVQTLLESKTSQLERELLRRDTVSMESEKQLQSVMHELETKNRQFTQLNNALKDVDKDFSACRQELVMVERQLNELTIESSEKAQSLEREKHELELTKEKLQSKVDEAVSLQSRLDASERSRFISEEKCLSLETDFAQCQAQIQSMSNDLGKFQIALESKDIDILKKDGLLSRMKTALREAQGFQVSQGCRYEELENLLQEKDRNLQQKITMITKLEMELADARSSTNKQCILSSSEIKKLHLELNERNKQVETLDDQASELRSQLSEVQHLNDNQGQEVNRLKQDVKQKIEQINQLEKSLAESRSLSEERHASCLKVSEELREAREKLNVADVEWKNAQIELLRLQKQQQQLMSDLNNIGMTDQQKDEQFHQLSIKLANCMNDKESMEKKYSDELERLRNDVTRLHEKHQYEIQSLKSTHANELKRVKFSDTDKSDELVRALERENEWRMQLDRAQQTVADMEQELLARKQVIEAANETIVSKVAEIVQLETKLNDAMQRQQMENQSRKISELKEQNPVYSDNQFLPTFLQQDYSPQRPTTDHDNTSTFFSGLDPDNSSIAPSFLNVAASTSKPVKKQIDKAIENDQSFVDRVFNDFPPPDFESSRNTSENIAERLNREGMEPTDYLAELEERLRTSEQRRKEVSEKLTNIHQNKL